MKVKAGKKAKGRDKDAKQSGSSTEAADTKRSVANRGTDAAKAAAGPLSNKEYAKAMKALHVELVKLQQWVQKAGLKVCIVFEGRDGAGKGGTIKAITERVSPRVFRVIALPAPTERQKGQMYIQRYIPHLPAAGEVVIFDRSWYNRAGVERVMGFCTDDQAKRFLARSPPVEKAIVESGIILIKYWLEVSPDEQTRRLEGADRGRPQALEAVADGPQVVQPLVRLLACPRRHVPGDRFGVGAVVRRALGRQEGASPQRDQAPALADSVRAHTAREDQAAQAAEARRLPRARVPVQVRAGVLLISRKLPLRVDRCTM